MSHAMSLRISITRGLRRPKSAMGALLVSAALLHSPQAMAALTANANGTVTDTVTGLVWDQCPYGLTGPACAGGVALSIDWPAALNAAVAANTASYKTYTDWRLPNGKELESIVKRDASSPAIDSVAFPATPSGVFWSSSSYAPNPASAWYVFFADGYSDAYYTSNTYYVRLVRSGQPLAAYDKLSPQRTTTGPTATASGAQTVSFTPRAGANAGCAFADSQWVPALSRAASLPSGIVFPHGLFRFSTNNCGSGAVLDFTVTLPTAVAPGTPYYKYGKTAADPTPHWYILPATLNGAGTQYTFSITDGGLGDDDLVANGFISDDGGPGVPGADGAVGIPTLGEWGLLLLAGLLAALGLKRAGGLRVVRRR